MNMLSKQLLGASTPAIVPRDKTLRASMSKRAKGLSSYDQVQEHDVASTTSATKLITMLFDKACVLLTTAMRALESDDDQVFHQSALHALQIVLSLRFVLDTDGGSELSQSLFGTYTTIAASLKKAKEEEDAAAIATIYEALDELRTAWHSVT
jgi:flagellar biosynthetic protein FliS